ncbi:MAG: hypothetical protein K2H71_10750 [Muribaculaceae bacterium]|nr:hypothetical protein [Muribaculaceae bacterium]
MKKITFTELLGLLDCSFLSEHGIEFLICDLKNAKSFDYCMQLAQELRNTGKIVLGIGIMPIFTSIRNGNCIHYEDSPESPERGHRLKSVVDGMIFLWRDSFVTSSEFRLNSKEIDRRINSFICDIEQVFVDILTPGVRNIGSDAIKGMLHNCGRYAVARGSGKGGYRVEKALSEVMDFFRFCGHYMMQHSRSIVFKIMVPQKYPLSKEEQELIEKNILEISSSTDIHLCVDHLDSEDDNIEIIVLSIGLCR